MDDISDAPYLSVIAPDSDGVWLFTTVSGSTYVLDVSKMTLLRVPAKQGASELRKDFDQIDVVRFDPIKLGQRATLILTGLREGALTVRETTEVTYIALADR